jgi:hemoglobin
LFNALYDRVVLDSILRPVFAKMSPQHFRMGASFVSEVLGGPTFYSNETGHGHASMVAQHVGHHLTQVQRKRWMEWLLDTADQLGLPDDPEFKSAWWATWSGVPGSRFESCHGRQPDRSGGSNADVRLG